MELSETPFRCPLYRLKVIRHKFSARELYAFYIVSTDKENSSIFFNIKDWRDISPPM